MPYIKKAQRHNLDKYLDKIYVLNGAELNYCFTKLCHIFIKEEGESYATFIECISALECAKQELYRRKVAPYEDKKIEENGDIE